MINKGVTLIMLLIGFTACTTTATKQKSPECYYESYDTYAEVIEIKDHPDGDGRKAVMMDFKASKLALATQELGDLKDIVIDKKFVKKHNIRVGNKYEVLVTDLTRGDCEIKQTVAFSHRFK